MARVTIENEAFIDLAPLAKDLGWSEPKVIGHLVCLWHGSQLKFRNSGSVNDIRRWARCDENEVEIFVRQLVDHEFLEKIGNAEFLIRGNKKHVKNLKALKQKRVDGGKKRAKEAKRDKKGHFEKSFSSSSSRPASIQLESSSSAQLDPATIQCNAVTDTMQIQCNADTMQCNTLYSDLAGRWLEFAKSRAPHLKFKIEEFADGIEHVCRNTPITFDQLSAVFDFIRQDDFWQKNALSPRGLMKRSDRNGLRKIDNILTRFKEKHGKYDAVLAWANDPDAAPIDPFTYDGVAK